VKNGSQIRARTPAIDFPVHHWAIRVSGFVGFPERFTGDAGARELAGDDTQGRRFHWLRALRKAMRTKAPCRTSKL